MRNLFIVSCVVSVGLMGSLSVTAAPATYEIDPAHSSVDFKIRHLGISWVRGSFGEIAGEVTVDPENPEKSVIEVTVQAASVDTRNDKRDEHLRSDEYFDVENHPTLTFKSSGVKKTGENTYEVTGDFTLLGVTKPITVMLTDSGEIEAQEKTRRGGEVEEFTISRSDFGMDEMVGPIGDEVHILLAFSTIKK